ncbi:hypothetical protein [Cryptosporangium minutisporangium]|uniref:Uncharacterized protein n=1 Tax=Cryptosporangium minutisporangium TaxID=113569 RepID=A0ABP6SS03_9ACTN
MYSGRVPSAGAKPWARPGRLPVVTNDLARLHGPTSGQVELPHRLFWQAHRVFDLDQRDLLRWMYEIVLAEARSQAELEAWLDGRTLQELWGELFLPPGVLHAWESRHPQLRARAA